MSVHDQEHEMYDVVSEEGESLPLEAVEWLRNLLAGDQALRASDGEAENTYIFWYSVGERNGLQWRNINWTSPRPATSADVRAVLDDAEDLTLQILPKVDYL